MTDTMLLVGKLVEGDPGRDAIHIAVVPMVSGSNMPLYPGSPVKFMDGDQTKVVYSPEKDSRIGVVDPYLDRHVLVGERFWLFMYPATITSLKHRWVSPSFPDDLEERKSDSRKWMEDFASSTGYDFHAIMARAADHAGHDYANRPEDGYSTSRSVDIPSEFWHHYENITGRRVGENDRHDYFSCSC